VTIAAALEVGARRVVPVATVEQATAFLNDPTVRVAGERGGAKVPRFRFGNSPSEILAARQEIAGRVLVLTTSNGTRCVEAARAGAAALVAGAAVNATAVALVSAELARSRDRDLTLVSAGLHDQPSIEDTHTVALIAARLADRGARLCAGVPTLSTADTRRAFLSAPSAARLKGLGYDQDVHLCAQVDVWKTVPWFRDGGFVAYAGG
jgi:2-phosphosulfolactate phosphatase